MENLYGKKLNNGFTPLEIIKRFLAGQNNGQGKFLTGFTLIELLVVIAIIGILTTVVIIVVNSARNKGKDAAIQTMMDQIRKKAALDFNNDGNHGNVCTEAADGVNNSDLNDADSEYSMLENGIFEKNNYLTSATAVVCNESTDSAAFAAWTQMTVNPANYWCVDSDNENKELVSWVPVINLTECP